MVNVTGVVLISKKIRVLKSHELQISTSILTSGMAAW